MKFKVYTAKTKGNKDLILDYIKSLPTTEEGIALNILQKLEEDGIEALEILNTRQLRKKLWEIKFYRHNRFMYVTVDEEEIYILHACKKQKGKAENFELEKAVERAKILGEQLGKIFI